MRLDPIDLSRNLHKYDEDRPWIASWYEFGRHRDGSTLDIASAGDDVFTHVPCELGDRMIELRNKFVKDLKQMINEHYIQGGPYGVQDRPNLGGQERSSAEDIPDLRRDG